MLYALIIPVFLFREVWYLCKHPKAFSPLAAVVWFLIALTSVFFMENNPTVAVVPLIHAISVGVYYWIRDYRDDSMRPPLMRVRRRKGPRRYRTAKEVDAIIKKITAPNAPKSERRRRLK